MEITGEDVELMKLKSFLFNILPYLKAKASHMCMDHQAGHVFHLISYIFFSFYKQILT
jgi:hypothetical protein